MSSPWLETLQYQSKFELKRRRGEEDIFFGRLQTIREYAKFFFFLLNFFSLPFLQLFLFGRPYIHSLPYYIRFFFLFQFNLFGKFFNNINNLFLTYIYHSFSFGLRIYFKIFKKKTNYTSDEILYFRWIIDSN